MNSFSPFASLTSSLSDYNMIRSGAYKKLMTSYFAKMTGDGKNTVQDPYSYTRRTNSVSKDSAATIGEIKESADELQDSASKLVKTGTQSLFNKVTTKDKDGKETTGYDTDKIYKAVKDFVKDYNNVLEAADESNTSSIRRATISMINSTNVYKSALSDVGITIGSDNQLSIDESKFKSADMSKVKSLFNGSGSFAYNVKSQANMIEFRADTEASKTNTYTSRGYYGNAYSSGSMWDSYF